MARQRVLVIDDDANLRALVSAVLTGMDLDVSLAETGEAGIERARALRPDLVVVDDRVAGMSGWEILGRLKGASETRAIPVIALAAFPARRTRGAARPDALLPKPFAVERLEDVVRQCLNLPRRSARPGSGDA